MRFAFTKYWFLFSFHLGGSAQTQIWNRKLRRVKIVSRRHRSSDTIQIVSICLQSKRVKVLMEVTRQGIWGCIQDTVRIQGKGALFNNSFEYSYWLEKISEDWTHNECIHPRWYLRTTHHHLLNIKWWDLTETVVPQLHQPCNKESRHLESLHHWQCPAQSGGE